MKKKKAIVFLLLLLMVVTLFYGCHPLNYVDDFESLVTEESSEQTDKRPVALSSPAYLSPPFYAQGVSSAETCGYGEDRKSLTETESKASLYEQKYQRLLALLDYALENGVISEEEYNTEINRLETEEIFSRHCTNIDKVEAIPSPDDDSYYNHVLDPRVDWDKAYPTFWEWLGKLLEELLSNIF